MSTGGVTYEDVIVKTSKLHTKIRERYRKKILLLRGGSSSTKTQSSLDFFAEWLLTGKFIDQMIPSGVGTIARKYASTLHGSVIRDWEDKLATNGWDEYVEVNKTLRRWYCGRRYVEFIGIDEPKKVKGPRRQIGYMNEVNEFDFEDFFQFEIRTRNRLILDFNPDDEEHWVNMKIEQERLVRRGDVDLIVSTYKDNPFLTKSEIESIEYYKDVDPQLWAVYGLGQYGKIKGRVFEHFEVVDDIGDDWTFCAHGLDFGYTNDPTSLVQLFTRNGGNDILLDELIYETGLTNPQISALFREYEIPDDDDIIGDSSEPKSIQELIDLGHNVKPVKKGEDSVRFGINLMKSRRIYVTRTSINLIRELKKYVWKKLADGKYSRLPVDKNNHAIDAVRYAVMFYFGQKEPEPEIYIS